MPIINNIAFKNSVNFTYPTLSIQPHIKQNINKINIRKTENINPLKNIFNALNLSLKSKPIDSHKLLVFHLILPQLGRTTRNNINDIMVPIILRLFELISRSKR